MIPSFIAKGVPNRKVAPSNSKHRYNITRKLVRVRVIYFDVLQKLLVATPNNAYDVAKWDDISGCPIKIASPFNDKYVTWSSFSRNADEVISNLDIVKKFWWRYKPGQVLYGNIINNVFHEQNIRIDPDVREDSSAVPSMVSSEVSKQDSDIQGDGVSGTVGDISTVL